MTKKKRTAAQFFDDAETYPLTGCDGTRRSKYLALIYYTEIHSAGYLDPAGYFLGDHTFE